MEFRNYMERFRWVRLWQNRIVASFQSICHICFKNKLLGASLEAQRLKCLPPVWETRVRSLVWEDPLEKEMAPHSNILAWRIPWPEEPGRLQSMGPQRVRHDWETPLSLSPLPFDQFIYCNHRELHQCTGLYTSTSLCFPMSKPCFPFCSPCQYWRIYSQPSMQCTPKKREEHFKIYH